MEKLLGGFLHIRTIRIRNDDSTVERLSRKYTSSLLLLLAILVSSKQYMGDPIDCWCPAEFTSSQARYTDTLCWVSDTFYLPPTINHIPTALPQDRRINYYQWVPLILAMQSICFYLPSVVWRFLHRRSGMNLTQVVEAAQLCNDIRNSACREKSMKYLIAHIDQQLRPDYYQRQSSSSSSGSVTCYGNNGGGGGCNLTNKLRNYFNCKTCKFCDGYFLPLLYGLIRLIYALNAVGQIFLLNRLLGTDFYKFGILAYRRYITGEEWSLNERFPKVTICSFDVRHHGRMHNYIIQCALPINLFNEKIFIFLWFWLVFVALISVLSSAYYLLHFTLPGDAFLQKHLAKILQSSSTASGRLRRRHGSVFKHFRERYLKRNGEFVLQLISDNAGFMVASELVCSLWSLQTGEKVMGRMPAPPPPTMQDAEV